METLFDLSLPVGWECVQPFSTEELDIHPDSLRIYKTLMVCKEFYSEHYESVFNDGYIEGYEDAKREYRL